MVLDEGYFNSFEGGALCYDSRVLSDSTEISLVKGTEVKISHQLMNCSPSMCSDL